GRRDRPKWLDVQSGELIQLGKAATATLPTGRLRSKAFSVGRPTNSGSLVQGDKHRTVSAGYSRGGEGGCGDLGLGRGGLHPVKLGGRATAGIGMGRASV